MLSITINDKSTYASDNTKEGIAINGAIKDWQILSTDNTRYEILVDNKVYNAEVVSIDVKTKTLQLKINGKLLNIKSKDEMDLLLEKLGIDHHATSAVSNIKAPMPGLILEIFAEEGKEVAKDEPVLVLEAMKMENVIKSPTDGIIKSVKISKGDSVDKNQVLVEF